MVEQARAACWAGSRSAVSWAAAWERVGCAGEEREAGRAQWRASRAEAGEEKEDWARRGERAQGRSGPSVEGCGRLLGWVRKLGLG